MRYEYYNQNKPEAELCNLKESKARRKLLNIYISS